MDRNGEARRAISTVGSNGFNRRRHRTSSLRDEDMGLEVSMRLRERVKKDRGRDRDLRERADRVIMKACKRRRKGTLMNHIGNDETSEESGNDDEDEDNNHINFSFNHNMTNCINNKLANGGSNHHLQQRKSFPLSSTTTSDCTKACEGPRVWRYGDEVISVFVPRKARSGKRKKASTKRPHYWISSTGKNSSGFAVADGEPIHRQARGSPASHAVVPASPPPSSSASLRKKPSVNNSSNNMGHELKPPRAVPKPSSSNPEELEIEIAEVLYGLMTQPQGPSSKICEVDRSTTEAKWHNSTSISNCVPKSSPITAMATKRKRPRQVIENYAITAKNADQIPKSEVSSQSNLGKISESAAEKSAEMGLNSVISQVQAAAQPTELESAAKTESESKPSVVANGDFTAHKMTEFSGVVRTGGILSNEFSTPLPTSLRKEEKFEIDLMAPPPQLKISPPERDDRLYSRSPATTDQKPVISDADVELKPLIASKDKADGQIKEDQLVGEDEEKSKVIREETKPFMANDRIVRKFDLGKRERDGSSNALGSKLLQQQKLPVQANIQPLFSRPGRKRCATHCHIAKNIYYHQQLTKMSPYKGPNNARDDKTRSFLEDSKGSLQMKLQRQVVVKQAFPPVPPNNLRGPAFIFPLNQQQAAQTSVSSSASGSSTPSTALNFNYPNMGVNETQFLAILQNNGCPFPIPAGPNFRGPPPPPAQGMPMFNGLFYPQLHQSSSPFVSQPQQIPNASNGSSSSQMHHQRPQRQVDGQNFMMSIHPQNFTLMTAFASSGNSQGEKKTNQPIGESLGMEPLTPRNGLAVSFGPGIDVSSMVQNHGMNQNPPEASRQNAHMMAAEAAVAAQAAQKKNAKVSKSYYNDDLTNNVVPVQSQSPQWKRSASARAHSSLASPASTTLKGIPQLSCRSSQPAMNAQISFSGSQKPSTASSLGQAQTGANRMQIPSSPLLAGSPTTSSVSRGASGSPRTSFSATENSKKNQGSLLAQQPKNSIAIPVQKPPSSLGNPHVSSSPSSNSGAKPQTSQQRQLQQLMLMKMQQGNLIVPNPLMKRLDKGQQPMQVTCSSGLLSLSPSMANKTSMNDPSKATTAAANNAKNGGLPSRGVFNAFQLAAQPDSCVPAKQSEKETNWWQ